VASNDTLRFMRTLWSLVHGLDVRSKWMERNLGVTGPQRLVLRAVGASPGITASGIAERLDLHPSTLTGILSRLEERGQLVRETDQEDRRRARFELTAKGKKTLAQTKGTVETAVRKMLARTGDGELAHTEEVLRVLVEELERE